jgi:carbamoyltransferase
MIVLGLSPLDKDSTVTLMEDGKILYAAAEERFTRVKLQDGFPWHALADAFSKTGVKAEQVESVAYPFLTWEEETRLFERNLAEERQFLEEGGSYESSAQIRVARERLKPRTQEVPGLRNPNERMEKSFVKTLAYKVLANESVVSRNVAKRESSRWGRGAAAFHRKWHEELESSLEDLGLGSRLKRVEHHLSHAANAYYTSGFDQALIVTLDGYGSGLAGSISIGRGGNMERIHCLQYPHSLGTFYESVTSALGFQPSRHEGKIVGLAAYGDPSILRDVLLSRFEISNGDFRIVEINNLFFSRMLATEFPKIDVAACVPARAGARRMRIRRLLLAKNWSQEHRPLRRRRSPT